MDYLQGYRDALRRMRKFQKKLPRSAGRSLGYKVLLYGVGEEATARLRLACGRFGANCFMPALKSD